MTKKYKGKYRSDTTRARWWDYGSNGAYFVTINTKNRVRFFGKVENKKVILSPIGQIAYDCWKAIPDHYPFVSLGEFVVMPDHVHGIVNILKPPEDERSEYLAVKPKNFTPNVFGPQSENLGAIIKGYKIGVTTKSRKLNPKFAWQKRFHDRIIRDEIQYNNVSSYIQRNPDNWKD